MTKPSIEHHGQRGSRPLTAEEGSLFNRQILVGKLEKIVEGRADLRSASEVDLASLQDEKVAVLIASAQLALDIRGLDRYSDPASGEHEDIQDWIRWAATAGLLEKKL